MSRYLLDSNYWINAGNYYPKDIFPSFWDAMKTLLESGDVVVHQTVMDELDKKDDEVPKWLHSVADCQVMQISEGAFKKYLECCQWAEDKTNGYSKSAIDEFEENSRADAWICAEACVSNLIIVTDEKKSNSPNKVKIPNVCTAFNIEYISNLDFMRRSGFSF